VDKSGGDDKESGKGGKDVEIVHDDAVRHSVSSPTQTPALTRPYSKKSIATEHKESVFVVYSAQIAGEFISLSS
jgi:hypothetical protein